MLDEICEAPEVSSLLHHWVEGDVHLAETRLLSSSMSIQTDLVDLRRKPMSIPQPPPKTTQNIHSNRDKKSQKLAR